jgi:hypothetical protein
MPEPTSAEAVVETNTLTDEQSPAPESSGEATPPQPDQQPEDRIRAQKRQELAANIIKEIKEKATLIDKNEYLTEEQKNEKKIQIAIQLLENKTQPDNPERNVVESYIDSLRPHESTSAPAISEAKTQTQDQSASDKAEQVSFFDALKAGAIAKTIAEIQQVVKDASNDSVNKAQQILDKAICGPSGAKMGRTADRPISEFINTQNDLNTKELQQYLEDRISPELLIEQATLSSALYQQYKDMVQKLEQSPLGHVMNISEGIGAAFEEMADPMNALRFFFAVNEGYSNNSRFGGGRNTEQGDPNKEKKTLEVLRQILSDESARTAFYEQFLSKDEGQTRNTDVNNWPHDLSQLFLFVENDVDKSEKLKKLKERMAKILETIAQQRPDLSDIRLVVENIVFSSDVIALLGLFTEKRGKRKVTPD